MAAPLNLNAVIGFGGKVASGLKWHPDGVHIVYPLGTTVVVRNTETNQQAFLQGHTDLVTCVALSKDGRYIASGQKTAMGFKAPIIVWDFDRAVASASMSARPHGADGAAPEIVHQLLLHKVAVAALDFSPCGTFLASLGGQDDNSLVVWETESGKAVCGSPAAGHAALCVRWFNGRSDRLLTGGQYHLRQWDFSHERRRLTPDDARVGSVKRIFTCLAIDDEDATVFAGTSSGDVLEVSLSSGVGRFVKSSPVRFSLGITCIAYVPAGVARTREAGVLVGTGDGALVRLSASELKIVKAAECMGGVTSIALAPGRETAYVGTEAGNLYAAATASMEASLRATAHAAPITDVVFPAGTSDLFLTAAGPEIRVWHAAKRAELLRIAVPNLTCLCLAINAAGTSIVSGWDDGKVRAFAPETGKLQYCINDAHAEAVTALAITHDGQRLVTGGRDGRVRTWSVGGRSQVMELSFKEHKKEVTAVKVSKSDEEAVSASADGSCLVWNLRTGTRTGAMFANTVFRTIVYHPDESQLLTAGSDRKLSYWDTADGTAIRVMDGSTEEITSVSIEASAGSFFASGGLDRLVKVWRYDEGDCIAAGAGHSGAITRVAVSPDARTVVSVGVEGAIFIWDCPA